MEKKPKSSGNRFSFSKECAPCGILNIAKQPGCTSRDVVNRIQRSFRKSGNKSKGPGKLRVGHAGTLDPMAEGVLLVCVGKATQMIQTIHEFPKSYTAEFILGQTSDTDDATGNVQVHECKLPDETSLTAALHSQVGTIMQTPPAFSAIKISGQRAYDLARKGHDVTIEPRPVRIQSIDLLFYNPPVFSIKVSCGSGTYIRSIGRDVGQMLDTGALMSKLTRNSIGPFELTEAIAAEGDLGHWIEGLHDVRCLFADSPTHDLTDNDLLLLKDGKPIEVPCPGSTAAKQLVAIHDDQFAALLDLADPDPAAAKYKAGINWVPNWFQNITS